MAIRLVVIGTTAVVRVDISPMPSRPDVLIAVDGVLSMVLVLNAALHAM